MLTTKNKRWVPIICLHSMHWSSKKKECSNPDPFNLDLDPPLVNKFRSQCFGTFHQFSVDKILQKRGPNLSSLRLFLGPFWSFGSCFCVYFIYICFSNVSVWANRIKVQKSNRESVVFIFYVLVHNVLYSNIFLQILLCIIPVTLFVVPKTDWLVLGDDVVDVLDTTVIFHREVNMLDSKLMSFVSVVRSTMKFFINLHIYIYIYTIRLVHKKMIWFSLTPTYFVH